MKNPILFILILIAVAAPVSAGGRGEEPMPDVTVSELNEEGLQTIYLGGGCFWCIEAVFEKIDGIEDAVSGYAGGHVPDPSYELVCSGTTGHAEVVKIVYNPDVITLNEVLNIFFAAHDPTTMDRQGADVGSQYRSIILYVKDDHKRVIEETMAFWDSKEVYPDPIVTEVVELDAFFRAEEYHQDFYENNPNYPYCRIVIAPKLKKLGLE